MGKLPRRIETPIGFVYVLKGGYYPCGDKDDTQKLLALGEIFYKAVEKGALVIHGDEKRRIAPNLKETKAHLLLRAHVQKNFPYSEKLDVLLGSLAQKSNKKFFSISIEELEKILGKDWELEMFAGEMMKK